MNEPTREVCDQEKEILQTPYDAVIPTGWLTAYGRTFSDIPYAQEIFDELENTCIGANQTKKLQLMKDTALAPQFEARYKLLDKLITDTGIVQILEIAAGFSTRGLSMTSNEAVEYIEVDLPAMVNDKRKILDSLKQRGAVPSRRHLHIENGNAVDSDSLIQATKLFEPTVVVNEGLLRYLSHEAKTNYAQNVAGLLKKFGGLWITSDISLPKVIHMEEDIMKNRRQQISEITGVNIADNMFKDEADAKAFFGNLGFEIESHSFLEVSEELVSPKKLGMTKDYVEALNGSAVVFVMKLSETS